MPKNKKNEKSNVFLVILIIFFVAYAVKTLTSQQIQIREKKLENQSVEEKIIFQDLQNDKLREMIKNTNDDEYIARIARENYNYVSRGERVFIDDLNGI